MSSDGWPDEEEQEAPRQPDLKFGKHRGKEIDDPSIPVDYLQWLVDDTKGERPVKSDWMAGKIMAEVQRRLEAGEVPEVRPDAARAGSTARIKRPTTTTSEHPVNENTTPATPARDTRLLLLLQDCVNRLTRIEAHLGVKAGQQIPLEDDEVF